MYRIARLPIPGEGGVFTSCQVSARPTLWSTIYIPPPQPYLRSLSFCLQQNVNNEIRSVRRGSSKDHHVS